MLTKFRIESFGSLEYRFNEIILRTRDETKDFLKNEDLLKNYEADIKKIWDGPEDPASILNLRLPCLLQLEYTYKCNLYCKYCYSASSLTRKELMSFDKFKYITNLIDNEDIFEVHVLGGEPFLFPEYLKYLLENLHGKFITIATNGTLINETHCKWITNSPSHVNIGVGIDGHTEYIHNSTRGDFIKICKTLDLLNTYDTPIQVTTCITRYNYDKIEDMLKFLIAHNVSSVQIIPVAVSHLPRSIVSELEISSVYHFVTENLPRLIKAYKDQIFIDSSFPLSIPRQSKKEDETLLYGPCTAGVATAAINPQSELIPCPASYTAPSVRITNSIETAFRQLKKELRKRGRKIIERDEVTAIQQCCNLFGYGQAFSTFR